MTTVYSTLVETRVLGERLVSMCDRSVTCCWIL